MICYIVVPGQRLPEYEASVLCINPASAHTTIPCTSGPIQTLCPLPRELIPSSTHLLLHSSRLAYISWHLLCQPQRLCIFRELSVVEELFCVLYSAKLHYSLSKNRIGVSGWLNGFAQAKNSITDHCYHRWKPCHYPLKSPFPSWTALLQPAFYP